MDKTPRFLDLYHADEVPAQDIDHYIAAWHTAHVPPADQRVSLHVCLGLSWQEYQIWGATGALPTLAEHAVLGRADEVFVGPAEDRRPLRVHGPLRCRPVCPVHWPSDHPTASWPLQWYEDLGIMARLCVHDVGHPDPDDQQVRLHPELAEHDCDGCCRPTIDGELAQRAIAAGGSR